MDKSDSIRDAFHLRTLNSAAASPHDPVTIGVSRSLGPDGPNHVSLVSI